jgi:esterase/lipase superfamily enzyme
VSRGGLVSGLGWLYPMLIRSTCVPVAIALLAAGCASVEPHLVPTPAVLKDPRIDFRKILPVELHTTRLPVFYATTRASGGEHHYSNAERDGVMYGIARVRLGAPGWTWDDLMASHIESTTGTPRPGAVESVEELGSASSAGASGEAERAFVAAIDAHLARVKNPEIIAYVHGYRVAFDEVAVQMGSFSHFVGQGATVTFQWPTGAMFWNYITDCPRAERYIPDIERLLELLARTQAEYINVMAYSCGSPLLAAALARLRARHPEMDSAALQKRYRFGNVIFVASDIDLKTFAREHLPPALDLSRQLVIYFSRIDRALGFSTLIAGASRLGRPDVNDLGADELKRLMDPRIQAIDVTDVRGAHEMGGMKGHGYWYANDWISTDVTLSLRYPIPPENRCLENRPVGTRVWRMPDTYIGCVSTKLLEAFPQITK